MSSIRGWSLALSCVVASFIHPLPGRQPRSRPIRSLPARANGYGRPRRCVHTHGAMANAHDPPTGHSTLHPRRNVSGADGIHQRNKGCFRRKASDPASPNGHDLTRTGGRGAFPAPSARSAAKPEKCPSRLSAGAATQGAPAGKNRDRITRRPPPLTLSSSPPAVPAGWRSSSRAAAVRPPRRACRGTHPPPATAHGCGACRRYAR